VQSERAKDSPIDMSAIPGADASVSGVTSLSLITQTTGLSQCMIGLLSAEFSPVKVENTTYNVVNDAKFVSGIPSWVVNDPVAITLGLYNIHYDPNKLDINGGNNWDNIRTVVEELVHTEQFLNVWQETIDRRKADAKGTQVKVNVTYQDAQDGWKGAYSAESAKIIAGNVVKVGILIIGLISPPKDSYQNNKYEVDAKSRATAIISKLQGQNKKPCP
jgi:hypothetical protein